MFGTYYQFTVGITKYYKGETTPIEGTLNAQGKKKIITGAWDVDTATSLTPTIKLYTTWKEGTEYRIYNAKDLIRCADPNGHYVLYDDLDFAGLEWPQTFLNQKFSGKFDGNGYTIYNVTFETTSRSAISSGLFNSLESGAKIENLILQNLIHRIDVSATMQDAVFGLLCGTVAESAGFNNVYVSGSIVFGDNCQGLAENPDNYTINTIVGDGDTTGVNVIAIEVVKENEDNTSFDLIIEDGSVKIVSGS